MTDTQSAERNPFTFLGALMNQGVVIKALALRELQERFGRENIGYLWVIAEPMLLASVVTLLHTAVSKGNTSEVSPFTFMLTGYSIYIIFRNTFNRAEGALHGGGVLLYHGMITPFDIVLAKSLVETIGCVSALVILQTAGIMLGLSDLPFRPLSLIGAIVLFAWMAFVLALIVACYGYIIPVVGRLTHVISYFALPVSGAFITMSLLPKWSHNFMSWNPMMSIFELARYGQFASSTDKYVHISYVIEMNIFLTYWGLMEIRRIRKRIHIS